MRKYVNVNEQAHIFLNGYERPQGAIFFSLMFFLLQMRLYYLYVINPHFGTLLTLHNIKFKCNVIIKGT